MGGGPLGEQEGVGGWLFWGMGDLGVWPVGGWFISGLFGGWPIWGVAHLGDGPFGGWPIWGMAHFGVAHLGPKINVRKG